MISMLTALLVLLQTNSAPPPVQAQTTGPAGSAHRLKDLVHYEATGLSCCVRMSAARSRSFSCTVSGPVPGPGAR
jgi:hypothetical protein